MAKILFTWELGSGFGHIFPISQYCEALEGHEIFVALRDVKYAEKVFSESGVKVLAAPAMHGPVTTPFKSPYAFAHLLHNCGYSDKSTLFSLVSAWRNLYDLIEPDLVVFEYSPTAMLAAKGYSFRKVMTGNGFSCPPSISPMPVFFPDNTNEQMYSDLANFESKKLNIVNEVLSECGLEPLSYLGQIYKLLDRVFLSSFPELDHFPVRSAEQFVGVLPTPMGADPVWPKVSGKKIFVYSHAFDGLVPLLDSLARSGQSVIVYSSTSYDDQFSSLASENICFENKSLALEKIAQACDFAITNGNFNTSSQLALLGVPQVCIPLQQEQLIFSRILQGQGMAVVADGNSHSNVVEALNRVALSCKSMKDQAKVVAGRYKKVDTAVEHLVAGVNDLLA